MNLKTRIIAGAILGASIAYARIHGKKLDRIIAEGQQKIADTKFVLHVPTTR